MVAVLLVRFVSVLDAAAVALNTSVVPITELDGVTGTVSVIVCPLTRLVAVLQTTFWPVVEQPQPPVAVKVEGALTPVGRVNVMVWGPLAIPASILVRLSVNGLACPAIKVPG